MPSFGFYTPLMLLVKLKFTEDRVAEYLKIYKKDEAVEAVEAVEADETRMLHHTFEQDPDEPFRFDWSEVNKNDDALLAHFANHAVFVYLEAHAELGTDLSVDIYRTVGDKVIKAMN